MPAIIFDVHADQLRDFNLNLKWYTNKGYLVDLEGWGAYAEVRTVKDNTLVARSTHSDNIVLHTDEGREGEIDLNFAAVDMDTEDLDCRYELVMHPTAADPSSKPESIIRGLMKFRPKVAEPNPPD